MLRGCFACSTIRRCTATCRSEIPTSLAWLRERYRVLSLGVSPDASQLWLNWIVSRLEDRTPIGYVQATITAEPRPRVDGMDDRTRSSKTRLRARIRPRGLQPSHAQRRRRGSGYDRRAQRAFDIGGPERRLRSSRPQRSPRTCSMGSAAPTTITFCVAALVTASLARYVERWHVTLKLGFGAVIVSQPV